MTLKQARVGINATQQDIADKLSVHVQTYMNWEKHPEDMSVKDAMLFSKIVGVPFEQLFFLTDNSN